jgi:hypothetical protein
VPRAINGFPVCWPAEFDLEGRYADWHLASSPLNLELLAITNSYFESSAPFGNEAVNIVLINVDSGKRGELY